MSRHRQETINQLIQLRQRGYSIPEMMARFQLPKTTVWHHVHDVQILPEYTAVWRSKIGGGRKRKERAVERARQEAKRLLEGEDAILYGTIASLYWAEGSKGRCELVNTDGEMIRLYLKIIREHLAIPEERIQPVLRIFANHDQKESLKFWAQVTGIPEHRFKIYFNDGGTSGRTPYGMCRIVVLKGGHLLKLFRALSIELCNKYAPVAQLD